MRVLQQTADRQIVGLLLCGWHAVFSLQCQGEGIVTGAESAPPMGTMIKLPKFSELDPCDHHKQQSQQGDQSDSKTQKGDSCCQILMMVLCIISRATDTRDANTESSER